MKYFDYSTEGLDDGFDVERFLEKSERNHERRLEEEIERIKTQLEERTRIFEENCGELESKLEWYLERLRDEYRTFGVKSVDELKEKVEEFYRSIREEKKSHWRDRQELEQERREILRELSEVQESDLESLLEEL